MKRNNLLLFLLFGLNAALAQLPNEGRKTKPVIDEYIQKTMELHQIPGLALAIIKGDSVIHQNYYGYASLEHGVAVSKRSIFRIYSTTKLIVNVGIFQLVEAKKLSLEDEIAKYIDDLPQAWQSVKIKHLLSHSSGIPNFIRFESKLSNGEMMKKLTETPMEFSSGEVHAYNQTNYWLLAQIIEKVSGKTLEEFIIQNQFEGNSDQVIFSSNSSEVIKNRISKYEYDRDKQTYKTFSDEEKSRGWAGNGLNISLDRLIEWGLNLENNTYLKPETKQLMWSPFSFSKQDYQFAHGWAIYKANEELSYGFTGGGVSVIRVFPEQKITIILLTNGYKYYSLHNDIVNTIAGLVTQGELSDQALLLTQGYANRFIENTALDSREVYRQISQKYDKLDLEAIFNRLGYRLLSLGQYHKAVTLFELNAQTYPTSSNVYDSLAESYLYVDKFEKALKNYEQSLALNPNNKNADRMIQRINERIKSH